MKSNEEIVRNDFGWDYAADPGRHQLFCQLISPAMDEARRGAAIEKDKEIERLNKERFDLINQLRGFISMHETGLLPNRFAYEDAKMLLNGIGQ